MEQIKNIFKNKRVVLIGPAPELELKNKADFFNTFDLICGVNSTYNLGDNYGERIDILFNTTNPGSCKLLSDNINKKKLATIKYLLGTNKNNKNKNKNAFIKYSKILGNINRDIKCFDISDFCNKIEYDNDKTKNITCQFHTGTFAIAFLLHCDLTELYIDGITFYNNGRFGNVWAKGYFTTNNLLNNSHKGTMQHELEYINDLISNTEFKVDFDEEYCPLKKI